MAKSPQPAKKSYYFGKGYVDLWRTIKGAWIRNANSISAYGVRLSDLGGRSWIAKIFWGAVYILAMLAVIICGSAITAAITTLNVVILLVFMAIIYLGFTLIWITDRLFLVNKKIFTACHECKEKSLIPTYICPKCGEKHTNLTPGVYGILKRTCNCGQKLSTTFFNGRRHLDAECPLCGHTLSDRESRPICIPVVGGRSVGKTAFITAFSEDFISTVAPAKGFDIEFYNSNKQQIYNEIKQDYNNGTTRMTKGSNDRNTASSVSFSFFVKHPAFSPERLVHVYDIAGEVFTDNNENEVQKQYEYCQGIVLMIDPFAIPSIRHKYEGQLSPEDIAGIGSADINEIINTFLNKLREITGLSDNKMSSVPLAIVISKIDSAGLEDDLGTVAVNKLMSEQPEKFTDFYDTQDHLCRVFLKENNMESFLSNTCVQFKTHRFFACSAIGHSRDKGKYNPKGVMPPMEWLFRNADPKMGKLWNDNVFSKKALSTQEA